MKKSLVILALVAGCGASDSGGNNRAAATAGQGTGPAPAGPAIPRSPVRPSDAPGLAGLYQGGDPSRPNQLCIADKGDSTQFGLTVWGPNMAACSGAGLARAEPRGLVLTMTGDSACTIAADVKAGTVVLPAALPDGCAYYCGKGAALAGMSFALREGGAAGAAKAKDPAGDPLCS
jgi:hypothetical protein